MKKFNDYLRIKDAANFLGVTENTLRNWEHKQKIAVYRHPQNRHRLYDKNDLELMLSQVKTS
jgi:DNA-binding transcriptional MerR regulator